MTVLAVTRRPIVLETQASGAMLSEILGRIEGVVGRASLYGVTDPVFAKLFGAESSEAVFRSSYYRDGFVAAGVPEYLADWTFSRAGAGTALTDAGLITDFATGAPRITDKGLLIEGSAINYMKFYSLSAALFTANGFPNGNVSDATEPATAPREGLSWISLDNTSSVAFAYQVEALTDDTEYTISCLVETPDDSPPIPSSDGGMGDFRFVIGGTIPTLSFRVEPMRGRVWRVSGTGIVGTLTDVFSGVRRDTGQSPQSSRPLKFSGYQLEARPIASSAIITTGATATRGEDVCRFKFNPGNAFTLFVDCEMPPAGGDFRAMLSLTASDIANRVTLGRYPDGSMLAQLVVDEVPYSAAAGPSLPGAQRIRVAIAVRDEDFSACFNGGAVLSGTGPRPLGLERLWPGTVGGVGNTELGGYVRRVMAFDQAMTDAQLQAMTAP